MGNFTGHFFPGVFIIFWAVWWMFNVFKRQLCRKSFGKFTSELSFSASFRGWAFNFEVYLKIIVTACDIFFESSILKGGFVPSSLEGKQHLSLLCLFMFHGIMDLLKYKKCLDIESMDYFTLAVAFMWYGSIFHLHTSMLDATPLENAAHRVLMVCCFATAISILWESRSCKQFLPSYCRSYFLLCLGTWYCYMPFILYRTGSLKIISSGLPNTDWDRNDENNVQLLSTFFGGHLLVNGVFAATLYALMKCLYRSEAMQYPNTKFDTSDEKHRLLDE